MRSFWQSIFEDLRSRWIPAGLDLAQPFQVAWDNRAVDDAFRVPDFGRSSALGILVGNTRAIWPRFLDALHAKRPGLDERNPLDSYVQAIVLPALEPLIPRSEVRWARDPPPCRVAIQRLAHVSGLAYLSPSHLNVHGPWIALWAAIVIDIEGPSGPSPEPPNPCPDCERYCLPRFREAIAAAGATPAGHATIERHWPPWLAVRDACPAGRSHRYGDEQIRYHYDEGPRGPEAPARAPDHERSSRARDLAPARGDRDRRLTWHAGRAPRGQPRVRLSEEVSHKPCVTHCEIHGAGLPSAEADRWVRETLRAAGTLYTVDEALVHRLRSDAILTRLYDVCAVN